jgi:hypothetical protein
MYWEIIYLANEQFKNINNSLASSSSTSSDEIVDVESSSDSQVS